MWQFRLNFRPSQISTIHYYAEHLLLLPLLDIDVFCIELSVFTQVSQKIKCFASVFKGKRVTETVTDTRLIISNHVRLKSALS